MNGHKYEAGNLDSYLTNDLNHNTSLQSFIYQNCQALTNLISIKKK